MASHSSADNEIASAEPESVRERVDAVATEVGRQAKRGLRATRDSAFERVLQASSGYCSSAAKAVRSGRDQMRQDGYQGSARALDRAAVVLEEVSAEIGSQDLVNAGAELVSIARRRPAVTLGIFAGAGFLLAFSLSGRDRSVNTDSDQYEKENKR